MLNVNKITSELSMLPDSALQQFAQMHKADPYMLSLAVAESGRRKDMRGAAQAQAGGPQPNVADQEIAGMAPQPAPAGVASLPAPNMQGMTKMATGGIVAFADGGDTTEAGDVSPIFNIPDYLGEQWKTFRRWQQTNAGRAMGAKTPGDVRKTEPVERVPVPEGYTPGAAAPDAEAPDADTATPEDASGIAALATRSRSSRTGTAPQIPVTQTPKAERPDFDEMAAAVKKASASDDADTDKAYGQFAQMLNEDRAEVKGHDNIKDALIRAGLGMMSSKSPYALQGIGEGATQGFEVYQKAQEQDRAALRSNTQAQMLLMQAQRAERSGNHKDATALYGQYRAELRDAQNADRHAAELKSTDAYRNAELKLRQQQIDQQGEYYRAMGANKNPAIATLRAQQASIQAQLKADPAMQYTNPTAYAQLTAELQSVTQAIAQQPGGATMPATAAPSSAGWGKAVVK